MEAQCFAARQSPQVLCNAHLQKNVSLSPVQSALAKSLDLNPPGMNSYKNTGGSPHLAKQEKGASSFPASLPPCFLLRGRLECASILLWAAFAEGGEGSSGKMQKQAWPAIIFLAGLAMGFQMTTGELEAQDRGQARSMAISRYGIVAAESPLVAPMSNGIGGDLFALVYDAKTGKLYGLNASGWAPTGLNIELLKSKGFRAMPEHGIY